MDATKVLSPPYTLYQLTGGDLAIRRQGSIMKM